MAILRKIQKAIFVTKTSARKLSNANSDNSNDEMANNKVLSMSLQIDSSEDTVEIFEQSSAPIDPSTKKNGKQNIRKRTIHAKVQPFTIGISYWSLERIFLIVNNSLGYSQNSSRIKRFLDNLLLLKNTISQRPLNYLENYISAERKKNIEINVKLKAICLKVYENSSILKNAQVLDLKISSLNFSQRGILPKPSEMTGPERYDVYVERELTVRFFTISALNHQAKEVNFQSSSDLDTKDWQLKPLLTTSAAVLVKSNLIKNSPLLIDQQVKVFVPKIELIFPNDTYHIAKIMSIVSQSLAIETSTSNYDIGKIDSKYFQIASLIKEISPLLVDIEKEHYSSIGNEKKVCRHCILKYRKATMIIELIVGDHGNYDHLVKDFRNELQVISQGINGIYIKIPVSIENNVLPLNIGIPFLMIAHEYGPFKENTAVFISKIHSVTKDKFDLEIVPHYSLVEPERLFTSNFKKTLWKTFLDYYKILSTGKADKRVFSEVSAKGGKAGTDIHLLLYRRHYINKAMLGYMDGVRKADVDSVYKQFIMSKLRSVSISSNDMSAFASAFNILGNIMLNATLEKFIENLLRPIRATGLDKKLKRVERIFQHDIKETSKKDGKDGEAIHDLEEQIGPVIEFKDMFTLRELFAQLMLDVSITGLKFMVNFEDKSSGVRILIDANSKNTVLSINTYESLDYIKIDEFNLTFGEYSLKLKNISVNYEQVLNKFEFKFGFLTIDSSDAQEGRILQIGLDDSTMSKQLQYYAIFAEVFFQEDDIISSRLY